MNLHPTKHTSADEPVQVTCENCGASLDSMLLLRCPLCGERIR